VLDKKPVVRGLTWEIRHGENWALIGPNGAGKTSVLSMINGYRWPTRGKITVLGRDFGSTDLRQLRTEVGMVSAYLDHWISPGENVLNVVVSGKYGSVKQWNRKAASEVVRAKSILKMMSCIELKDKPMRELSQGERQKVLIGRALMGRPKLLTLDEPCEGLDMKSRQSFLAGLSLVAGSGETSIVVVTHRTEDIPAGFSHCLLLRDGTEIASGPIDSVITSKNMSLCFDVRISVKKQRGVFYAVAK